MSIPLVPERSKTIDMEHGKQCWAFAIGKEDTACLSLDYSDLLLAAAPRTQQPP